jgi:hypothetical protein
MGKPNELQSRFLATFARENAPSAAVGRSPRANDKSNASRAARRRPRRPRATGRTEASAKLTGYRQQIRLVEAFAICAPWVRAGARQNAALVTYWTQVSG